MVVCVSVCVCVHVCTCKELLRAQIRFKASLYLEKTTQFCQKEKAVFEKHAGLQLELD